MTKLWFRVVVFVVGVLLCGAVIATSQNASSGHPTQPASPPALHAQFFAGTVVELDETHIRVTRTLIGRPTESRNFTVTASTKMNKSAIKLHNRVTVRYKRMPEGDVALEIQPRPVIARTPKV